MEPYDLSFSPFLQLDAELDFVDDICTILLYYLLHTQRYCIDTVYM